MEIDTLEGTDEGSWCYNCVSAVVRNNQVIRILSFAIGPEDASGYPVGDG